eukprot:773498-Amorphochlora_amoeboformis.AAC.1
MASYRGHVVQRTIRSILTLNLISPNPTHFHLANSSHTTSTCTISQIQAVAIIIKQAMKKVESGASIYLVNNEGSH